ncbi:hypothetical protein SMGD1_0849 [Sulfurimonas gotlandica GD1]|uniref:Site-specific DNA-methyltransferase (adenine-specific) n=1 Tax=Sulfurimonas gotlandica (strain DSM 19862 / JCM 16533 / GD1) TaxID=929558 RepID=B6BM47_SULGG|nr:SAM-dependent methyltransferase [Sulfurimonas gotlandica]EDZ61946.1 hypothetical protein CBGD1_2030 [Sulfurimonas gotlandica GD1]EHP29376.1 hypothetical protein SMGD1_0849 [Sulfurimonas gotlandica GD1]
MSNINKKDKKQKKSTVFTPKELSYELYKIITSEYDFKTVFDPCIGISGGMTKYYLENGVEVIGADIDKNAKNQCNVFFHQDIKNSDIPENVKPDLIIMNPPFNGNGRGKNLLFPHLFLKTMFDRFGEDIPVVMITGDNFLNNNRLKSARLKYVSDGNFDITSLMTLPLDVFNGIKFNAQVLFFNMPKLKPFYIYDESKAKLNLLPVNNQSFIDIERVA